MNFSLLIKIFLIILLKELFNKFRMWDPITGLPSVNKIRFLNL